MCYASVGDRPRSFRRDRCSSGEFPGFAQSAFFTCIHVDSKHVEYFRIASIVRDDDVVVVIEQWVDDVCFDLLAGCQVF